MHVQTQRLSLIEPCELENFLTLLQAHATHLQVAVAHTALGRVGRVLGAGGVLGAHSAHLQVAAAIGKA